MRCASERVLESEPHEEVRDEPGARGRQRGRESRAMER